MLLDFLEKINDPRRAEGKRYKLSYVMIISIMAVLSGATSYRKIRTYMKTHRERLNELFGINWKSAPVHSTIQEIFSSLDVNGIELAFREHSFSLLYDENETSHINIAVDGKVLRGSFDNFKDQNALQMLSIFCQEEKLILCHADIATKTNEIPVAQELIRELGLEDVLYTFDALHCQKKTFEAAEETGSDVIVQVKENQPKLFEAVNTCDTVAEPLSTVTTTDDKRNRLETRTVSVFDASDILVNLPEWQYLVSAIIKVERTRYVFNTKTGKNVKQEETSYHVSSAIFPATRCNQAIRGHWGIENRNHHVRDVTLKEDASRIRRNPGIFARIRSFALNILRINGVTNVSDTIYGNSLDFNQILEYKGIL